ncbi:MAG: FtsX-like permease family protein, partial [Bacteroidia bacterium]|nr:FtsX-like permease family protein [Bacteroidia bacterium]
LNQKLPQLRRYYREAAEKIGFDATMQLVPLTHLRLYDYGEGSGGTITYVYILGVLALIILLIASANYINLATARSLSRAKEVGIRKVVGSGRGQLVGQFLAEAFVVVLGAFLLSLFLAELALPFFNHVAAKKLSIGILLEPEPGLVMGLGVLLLGLLSGLYPAFVLSSFHPVQVLKGKFSAKPQGLFLRKGLVIFQFTMSVVMIICTWVVFQQLRFIHHKDLGFDREQVLIMHLNDNFKAARANALKQKLLENPKIQQAALCNVVPAYNTWARNPYRYLGEDGLLQQIDLDEMPIGYDFLKTLNMKLVAGRDFSPKIARDSAEAIIVNEAFVKATGLVNPLGKTVERILDSDRKMKIIGVVRDFHLHSLHRHVTPTVLFITRYPYTVALKVQPDNLSATMDYLRTTWTSFDKQYPMDVTFLDTEFARRYETESKQGQVFLSFLFWPSSLPAWVFWPGHLCRTAEA